MGKKPQGFKLENRQCTEATKMQIQIHIQALMEVFKSIDAVRREKILFPLEF